MVPQVGRCYEPLRAHWARDVSLCPVFAHVLGKVGFVVEYLLAFLTFPNLKKSYPVDFKICKNGMAKQNIARLAHIQFCYLSSLTSPM